MTFAKKFTASLGLASIGLASLAAVAAAQEPAPPADPNPAASAQASSPEEEAFAGLLADLRKLVADLNDIRARHSAAAEKEQPALEKLFEEKVAEGQKLYPRLLPAAEKAFAKNPDVDGDAGKHLIESIGPNLMSGNSKDAQRVLKLVAPHVTADASVGMTALDAGDADLAVAQLSKVKIEDLPEQAREPVAKALAEAKVRQAEAKSDDLPRVKLETSKGDVVIELYENEAPNTVANFISLVEKKFYDGLVFHRVLDDFMAQGGDPTGTGAGGPGYAIPCECEAKNHRNHFLGTLSMAHAGKDTGGSQFFLTFRPTAHLDGKHTVFGRVIEGHDVLAKLQRIDPNRPQPGITPDKIVKATVVRKRDHEYKPKTLPDPR